MKFDIIKLRYHKILFIIFILGLFGNQIYENNTLQTTNWKNNQNKNIQQINPNNNTFENKIYQSITQYNHINRNDSYTFNTGYDLGDYQENIIDIKYYCNYSSTEYILNSTQDMIEPLILEKGKIKSYTLVHFYNNTHPFTSEISTTWDSNNYLSLSLVIDFNDKPFKLGKYTCIYELVNSTYSLVYTEKDTFYLTDIFEFETMKLLVYTPMYNLSWSSLSSLTGNEISPGDKVALVGHLKKVTNQEILAHDNDLIDAYSITIKMGGHEVSQNVTFYNESSHRELGIEGDNDQIITVIDIPVLSFVGNVEIFYELWVPIGWLNNSIPFDFLQIPSIHLEIPCNYHLSVEKNVQNPSIVWMGQYLNFNMRIYPTLAYNKSIRLNKDFPIPNVVAKCYFLKNSTYEREVRFQTRITNNLIEVGHPGFGTETGMDLGSYKINISGNNKIIYLEDNVNQSLELFFNLIEDYKVVLYSNVIGIQTDQIQIFNKYENVRFGVDLQYKESNIVVSHKRRFWIGLNENNRWKIEKSNITNRYVFDQSLHITENITELSVWVEFQNNSILKLDISILIILEKISATSSKSTSYPELIILLSILIISINKKQKP